MKQIRNSIITLSLVSLLFAGCQKNCLPVTPVVVDAGSSQTVQMPNDSVTLTGVVKSGLTPGMTYLWTLISGPNVPVFSRNDSAITIASGLETGTYVLQFQATNNAGSTGLDTTSIVVKPAVVKTITLQPDNNLDEVTMDQLNGQDNGSGHTIEDAVWAWTYGGLPYYSRKIIKFDLSTIPSSATIISADLFLYSTPNPVNGNKVDANYGVDNSLLLQRITSPWVLSTLAWSNQPSVTTDRQVVIPSTPLPFLDIDVDIKDLATDMVKNTNYGFLMRLQNEIIFTDRDFISSFNTAYPDKHPKLVITYK